ncbi:FAD-dependent oxidoreductase [Mucilaginibacter lacusdianchii]|uniref:FAD-dependent oxidoreductase n=1 Tax=Mucilaginibacter lacusdianchii TaxID=2684211 RepID=UPI00131C62D8|nr:FAD-dependent oxidoreductase [Mucilaginibacter sp. JXJ CY 39]
MKDPIIFLVDDDQFVLRAITRDLKTQYHKRYRVLSTTSANEALENLLQLKNKGEEIALFISDQRMPEMEGVEFLCRAVNYYPQAKRVLLTAYSDTQAAIKAINEVKLDYYLTKPWDPPQEKLFPVVDDLLDDWQANYRPDFQGIKVLGYNFSPKTHNIKEFLTGNLVPYQWLEANSDEAKVLIKVNQLKSAEMPAVIFEDGSVLKVPAIGDIAQKIGLSPQVKNEVYDVVIIGAGPAGLAASVYGASEGLKTLLIERKAPGGQAGTSSRIENYLGFPTGLSGADLTRRAVTQATRFGTEFLSPQEVKEIRLKDGYKTIVLEDDTSVTTRAVVVTTGVDYRKLENKGIDDFTGAGIYYGAATTEALSCKDKTVFIVGGGNSAGQAAMYLSKFAQQVFILVRKPDLTSTMSAYLIEQIRQTENISVRGQSAVAEAQGDKKLERLVIHCLKDNTMETVDADALYIFIGTRPFTDWLGETIIKNDKGFIETGRELNRYEGFKKYWKSNRDPYLLETSCPGIFAAGDVRAGTMNRVASAVGEGSMAISFVHKYLAEV